MEGRSPRPERSRIGGWPIAATLAVLAVLVYAIRYALLPFVGAIAIAFVVEPLIVTIHRYTGIWRWAIAAMLYLALLAVLAAAAYLIGTTTVANLSHLLADAPNIVRNLATQALGKGGITIFGQHYTPDGLVERLSAGLGRFTGIDLAARLAETGSSVVFGLLLALVLLPYFMISGPRLCAGAIWLIPPERRHSVQVVLPRIIPALRRYLVGIALVVMYAVLIAWLGFGPLFDLPHPLLLAACVGLLELVPVIGPLSSAAIVGVVAIQQKSLWSAAFLVVFAIGLRLSIDNVVGPLVLGKAARLHPVVIILAFVCGAMLFGVVGLLLAVPVAVSIKITLTHYYSEPIAESRTPHPTGSR
jgi:predicted PurR-regulated permease PerM